MSESFHLYITGATVYARRSTGLLWRRKVEVIGKWNWDSSHPESLSLSPLVKQGKRARLYIHVGAALCRLAVVAIPPGIDDEKEQLAIARTYLRDQMGLDSAQWEVSLDFVRSPAKAMACAIRREVMERINKLSQEGGFMLASVKPYVAGLWNAFEQTRNGKESTTAVLIAVEEDAFTSIFEKDGVFESAGALSHGRETDLLDRELRRVGLTFGDAAQKETRIALVESLLPLATNCAGRLLSKEGCGIDEIDIGFRDKLFVSRKEK